MPADAGDSGALARLSAIIEPRWHRDAACREHPELSWFPERGEPVRLQKAICSACAVRDECRAAAIAGGERYGVWGGTVPRERRRIRSTAA